MGFSENVLTFLRGYRKLFVALVTLITVVVMFAISLILLLKAYVNGSQFVDVVKALGSVISTVVVAYMGTNMAKHLLDAGKETVETWVKKGNDNET